MKIVNKNARDLCGVDEAGRGCLAGLLVICGVVLTKTVDGLSDSKTLSEKKREYLYEQIIQNSKYLVVEFKSSEVDKLGISECLRRGLEEIKEYFAGANILFDGNCTFGVNEISTMIKADTCIAEVSAASILAKVTRDRDMNSANDVYPQYGFLSHKGYGTRKHIEAIIAHGRTPLHRYSFKVKGLL